MPQLDFAHYASQIFWLAVMFTTLYFIMARTALPRVREVLQIRQDRIGGDLNKARQMKEEAEAAHSAYEKLLKEAQAKAGQKVTETLAALKKEEALRHAKLDETFARQAKEAEQKVAMIRTKAAKEMLPATVGVVREVAKVIAGIEISEKDALEAIQKAAGN